MEDKDKWPGVDAAFTFVVPSYQWMLTRIEAADSRLQAMQIVVLSVTTGAPTVAKAISGSLELRSSLLAGAMVFAILSLAVGMAARSSRGVTLADPAALHHKDWLELTESLFKMEMLRFSGRHFAQNGAAVAWKHRALLLMTGLFAVEIALLALWFWRRSV